MDLEFHQLDRRHEQLRGRRRELERRVLASLAESGQQTPIVVVPLKQGEEGEPDRYLVIDGFKRIRALEQLGRDTVEAAIWPMSEAEALLLNHSMRFSRRETALEEGWLLLELSERFGYGVEELARRFDRSRSWVWRRLALVELLPEEVQGGVRQGKISANLAMKYLAPIARARREDCRRMAEIFAGNKLSSREAGRLYRAWRDGPPLTRRRILEEPMLFLRTRGEADRGRQAKPASELLNDLEMVAAISQRARRRLASALPLMQGEELDEASQKLERAICELKGLARLIEKEESHVDQKSAGGDFGTARPGSRETTDRPNSGSVAPDGAASYQVAVFGSARDGKGGESRALSAADPRTAGHLQGQSGPGP